MSWAPGSTALSPGAALPANTQGPCFHARGGGHLRTLYRVTAAQRTDPDTSLKEKNQTTKQRGSPEAPSGRSTTGVFQHFFSRSYKTCILAPFEEKGNESISLILCLLHFVKPHRQSKRSLDYDTRRHLVFSVISTGSKFWRKILQLS